MARQVLSQMVMLVALSAAAAACSGGDGSQRGFGDGSVGGSGGVIGDPGGPNGVCTAPHCSDDLKSVVDCDGNVVMTCPDGQGCSGTSCTSACESAASNKSSVGCDYYSVVPDVALDGAGACYAVFVVNTWSTPVEVGIEFAGQQLDTRTFAYIPTGSGGATTYQPLPNGQIPPGEVAIFFLNRFPGLLPNFGLDFNCPPGITPAITTRDAAVHGTAVGSAFHITSTAPVAAYDMYPFGGGRSALTSATLLLPTTAWDTNYVAVDAYGPGTPFTGPFVQIVAKEDDTQVTINPTADIVGGNGVAPTGIGLPATYDLSRGQVLQLTQAFPLAGSVIDSTRPVGVWGGKSGLGIEACCDDSAHQQIPPVRALGNEYVGTRYRNRYDGVEETPPWRMVGAVNGTQLTYEPSPPPGAPATLDLGQVAEFSAAGPFVVRSQDEQHPFYMSAHMTGAGLYDPQQKDPNATMDGRGDPEFVNVVPPGEYLSSYTFFTDPTYSETNLVLVRTRGPDGFADVTLDCRGAVDGWQPIGSDYEYTRVDLVRGNFEPQGRCDNGRHEIGSRYPFGLTVWGWGSAATGGSLSGFNTQYVSYAYPAGAAIEPINDVYVPPVR